MKAKLHFVLSITIFFSWFYGFSQNNYWKPVAAQNKAVASALKSNDLVFEFNGEAFKSALKKAQLANTNMIYLPDFNGEIEGFIIQESPVFHPELSAKYPEINSYVGWNLERSKKVRFSFSHQGLQVMLKDFRLGKTTFVAPISKDKALYSVYKDKVKKNTFLCETEEMKMAVPALQASRLVDDQTLRRFRIAVSATGEYTDYHGGTIADALAAINATLTRVNEVFETDLGVSLELIANNDQIIFLDAATDPYTTNLNGQVQNTMTSIIGEANYDVGHLFHRADDNGNAGFIGSVCSDNRKGSAFASAQIPEGDLYDLDYVAHELGHQFGANHTWSFESEDTGVQAEPASGTTIMGYAGIVEGNNVAPNGDAYFHHYSISQIGDFLQTTSCTLAIPLTNEPPVITPLPDYKIPKGTPFVLAGNASDSNSDDVLTYAWEQIDDGVVTTATFGPDNVVGANFRSLSPTTNFVRYFPRLERVVAGGLEQTSPEVDDAWETVSNVQRDLNFALTVRDNALGGGQTSSDLVKVSISNAAGPFLVTSQNNNEEYAAGSIQEITWDVANTNGTEINASSVDIYISLDGGVSFPLLVADDVPNTGSAQIQIPGQSTVSARVMVRASTNIFFAVNATDFSIVESSVVLNFEKVSYEVCKPNTIQVPFVLETYGLFNETINFSADLPLGLNAVFSPLSSATNGAVVTIDITGVAALEVGEYPIDIIADSPGFNSVTTITLAVFENVFEPIILASPIDEATATMTNPEFIWNEASNASQYEIQIATDDLFTTIIEAATVSFNSFQSTILESETTYFWRVRPINNCGEGTFDTVFSFTTVVIDCKTFDTDEQPIEINAETPSTVTSTIRFVEDLSVSDINVTLELSHTYLEDLIISLTSPAGTTVALTSKSCGSLNNINVVFDDDGTAINCSGNPALEGVVRPLGALSSFNGESTLGDWILTIEDTAASDGGSLEAFSLDVCVEGQFRPDEDEDGVFDDGDDLCLGTPKGLKVDTSGCPLNELPANNFNIVIDSETCRDNNNGIIRIATADTAINYSASLIGNGLNLTQNFTEEQSFQNLAAGTYELCVSGDDTIKTYREQCFEIVITEPELLAVFTNLNAESQELKVDLSGADFYTVELNGIAIQTTDNSVLLDLKNGNNILKVSTDLPCQGIYEEQILVVDAPVLFPNPVEESVTIQMDKSNSNVLFELFGLNGQLVFSTSYKAIVRQLEVNLTGQPSGLYVAVLTVDTERYTYKLIKR